MRVVSKEFIFNQRAGHSCHASSLVLLDDGSLFAVWFGGRAEGRDDVCIYGARRGQNGTWSEILRLSEDDGVPHWNPVLHKRKDGAVLLFYKVGKPIADWYTKVKISYDNCATFSDSRELVPGDLSGGRGPVKNKAIYLSNGAILAPASIERGEWTSFMDLSYDNGDTWERTADITISEEMAAANPNLNGRGIIQPTVWESSAGKVHALFRSSESKIYRSDSNDYGKTWCKPYGTSLPNNNSGIDLDKTSDGKLILVYNPVSKNKGVRSPLSIAVSEDNGLNWYVPYNLETLPGEYSYPAVVCSGLDIYVTYTWNRVTTQFWHLQA